MRLVQKIFCSNNFHQICSLVVTKCLPQNYERSNWLIIHEILMLKFACVLSVHAQFLPLFVYECANRGSRCNVNLQIESVRDVLGSLGVLVAEEILANQRDRCRCTQLTRIRRGLPMYCMNERVHPRIR